METTFHGLEFLTAPGRVFTPRATTEALVDAALAHIDERPLRIEISAEQTEGTAVVSVSDNGTQLIDYVSGGSGIDKARTDADDDLNLIETLLA